MNKMDFCERGFPKKEADKKSKILKRELPQNKKDLKNELLSKETIKKVCFLYFVSTKTHKI